MPSQTTENRILEAAEEEFIKKGFIAARTTAIAEKAGVTHAMLHYYFRSKEKIFEKIIDSKIGLLSNIMLGPIIDPEKPLFEKLENAIASHLDFIASNPDLPRFFINEVSSDPKRMAAVVTKMRNHLSKVITSLQLQIDDMAEKGLCRKVDAATIILDIGSLNIFPFIASPVLTHLLEGKLDNKEHFVAERKRETTEIIMRKLKP